MGILAIQAIQRAVIMTVQRNKFCSVRLTNCLLFSPPIRDTDSGYHVGISTFYGAIPSKIQICGSVVTLKAHLPTLYMLDVVMNKGSPSFVPLPLPHSYGILYKSRLLTHTRWMSNPELKHISFPVQSSLLSYSLTAVSYRPLMIIQFASIQVHLRRESLFGPLIIMRKVSGL